MAAETTLSENPNTKTNNNSDKSNNSKVISVETNKELHDITRNVTATKYTENSMKKVNSIASEKIDKSSSSKPSMKRTAKLLKSKFNSNQFLKGSEKDETYEENGGNESTNFDTGQAMQDIIFLESTSKNSVMIENG